MADARDDSYAATLLAWDEVSPDAIVDFDVTDVAPARPPFGSEHDALAALDKLRAEHAPDSWVGRRLAGHIAYGRNKLGLERADLPAYIAATQAVPTELFHEADVDERRALAEAALARLGIAVGPRLEHELEAADDVIGIDDLPDAFSAADAALRPELEDALGHPLELDYETGFTRDDGWWTYWADTVEGRFRLRFNRRRRASLTATEVLQFTAHEVLGHFGQVHAYAQRIAAGELPRSFGITTVHTLEQFSFEGVAQTLPLWLRPPEEISDPLLARIRLAHLAALVEHNSHLMVNAGEPIDRCAVYVRERLPWYQPGRIAIDLDARANDPLDRSYRFVYPTAIDTMLRATERLDATGRRNMLRRLYERPMSYCEFVQISPPRID